MSHTTVADILLETIKAYGGRYIFGIPGDAINSVIDALRRARDLRFIQVRHEETGAFAASAIGKLSGELGVCTGTAGPGALHLLNGLYDARRDRAPVLAVTGQVIRAEFGHHFHQEVDLHAVFDDVAAYNEVVMSPEQAPRVFAEACRVALSENAVAHVNIPADVCAATVSGSAEIWDGMPSRHESLPVQPALEAAAELLNRSEAVAILAGEGCRDAVRELFALADRLDAPVIRSLRAKDFLCGDRPRVIGGLGLLGDKPAVDAVNDCDCLLLAGTDFPYRDFFPGAEVPVIQIDRNAANIGRRCPVAAGLCGDAGPTLAALAGLLEERQRGFLQALDESRKHWQQQLARREQPDSTVIKPQRLAAAIGERLDDDAIVCCDTGEVTAWAARHLHLSGGGQRFLLSANLASMAFALPAAIGACIRYPGRQVVALAGDGGLGMLMTDFITAVRFDLPITVIVFNNGKLGLIQAEQETRGYPVSEVELVNPDFAAFAGLCGGCGIKVRDPRELDAALDTALADTRPAIVDVEIDPGEMPLPPVIRFEQAAGFASARIKEWLGRGDAGGD